MFSFAFPKLLPEYSNSEAVWTEIYNYRDVSGKLAYGDLPRLGIIRAVVIGITTEQRRR